MCHEPVQCCQIGWPQSTTIMWQPDGGRMGGAVREDGEILSRICPVGRHALVTSKEMFVVYNYSTFHPAWRIQVAQFRGRWQVVSCTKAGKSTVLTAGFRLFLRCTQEPLEKIQPALLRHSLAIRRTVNVVLLRPGDSNTWPTGRKRPDSQFFVTLKLILITQCSLAHGRLFYLQNEKYFDHKMSKMFTIRRW